MATFNFPFHTYSTQNPDSSFRVKLGGSYQFSAPPPAPDQRIFKLKFAALKYFTSGDEIDSESSPTINLACLEEFYGLHKMHAIFIYPHPVYGDVPCSFNKPLIIPEGKKDSMGVIENIEVEFLEQPGMVESYP